MGNGLNGALGHLGLESFLLLHCSEGQAHTGYHAAWYATLGGILNDIGYHLQLKYIVN